jgi:adenylosuccinate synthase
VRALEKVEPLYEEVPGWTEPIEDARSLDDLPDNARAYLDRLAELTECPVALVGVGPNRAQTITAQETAKPSAA